MEKMYRRRDRTDDLVQAGVTGLPRGPWMWRPPFIVARLAILVWDIMSFDLEDLNRGGSGVRRDGGRGASAGPGAGRQSGRTGPPPTAPAIKMKLEKKRAQL